MQYLCCGRRQSTNLATIPETKLAWSVAACKLARIEVHAPRTTETERCATGRVIPALACTSLPAQTTYSELGPPVESFQPWHAQVFLHRPHTVN